MKAWMSLVLACAVAMTICSCKKKAASPYDPKVDAPPSVVNVSAESNILADQRELSRKATAAGAPAAPAAPTGSGATSAAPAAASGPVDPQAVTEIKAMMAQYNDALKAKPGEVPVQFIVAEDATTLNNAVTAVKKLQTAMETLKKEAAAKQITLPPDVEQGLSQMTASTPTEPLPVESIKFESSPEGILASAGPAQFVCVKAAGGWKLKIPAKAQEFVKILVEVLSGSATVTDSIAAGIRDGSINAQNLDAKAKEISEKTMGPAMEKFGKAMGAMMGEAMKGGMESGGPAPSASPAATPAAAPAASPAPAPAATPAAAPAGNTVPEQTATEIKTMLTQYNDAVGSSNLDDMLKFIAEEDKASLTLLARVSEVWPMAVQGVMAPVSMNNLKLPASFQDKYTKGAGFTGSLAVPADLKLADVKGTIVGTAADGSKTTFVKAANGWKMKLDDAKRNAAESMNVKVKAMQALGSYLESGSRTQADLDKKAKEIEAANPVKS